MKVFFMTIIIGISLSMDAFSLSLAYGTQKMTPNQKVILSLIVGLYHFIMPLIGLFFGNFITKYLIINPSILVAIIFILIGLDMIISSSKNKEDQLLLSIFGFLIFGLSVSLDSFTTGIGLNAINSNYLEVSLTFAVISASFTYLGLMLGNKLTDKFGKIATILGGIILIFLGIIYFFR